MEISKNIVFCQSTDLNLSYHIPLGQLIKLALPDLKIKHFCNNGEQVLFFSVSFEYFITGH